MRQILNSLYVLIILLVVYIWIQQTPAGARLPKIIVEIPSDQSTMPDTLMPLDAPTTTGASATPIATMTMVPTLTPSATMTPSMTATPAKFTTSVDTIVRRISSTRKLTTVETILDVVVTFGDDEKKQGWWDGGELLVQRTTVNVRLDVDMTKVSIVQSNNHLVVSVPAVVMDLKQEQEKPYYFSKGIRYAFQDGQKDVWRDMVPAEVDKQARARICALKLHKKASDEASTFIIEMALAMNPNMTKKDITVNLAPATECR